MSPRLDDPIVVTTIAHGDFSVKIAIGDKVFIVEIRDGGTLANRRHVEIIEIDAVHLKVKNVVTHRVTRIHQMTFAKMLIAHVKTLTWRWGDRPHPDAMPRDGVEFAHRPAPHVPQ